MHFYRRKDLDLETAGDRKDWKEKLQDLGTEGLDRVKTLGRRRPPLETGSKKDEEKKDEDEVCQGESMWID